MDEIINLKSRNSKNYLKKLTPKDGGDSKTFRLITEELIVKVKDLEGGKLSIMPSGGPPITSGEILSEAGEVVQNINYIPDYGYVITFK